MRIAFYGSSLLSSYWNGAATYYRGLLRELAHRGYDITFYEPDAFGRQQNRDMEPPEWCHVVVYEADDTSVRRHGRMPRVSFGTSMRLQRSRSCVRSPTTRCIPSCPRWMPF
jgi:hypothetical protein